MLRPSSKMILPVNQGSDGLIPQSRRGEMIPLLGPERMQFNEHKRCNLRLEKSLGYLLKPYKD